MVIAIDFDGVLNASPFPDVGGEVKGAKEAMLQLKEQGHELIIWTCREGESQIKAINWLLDRGIPFDGVNCNSEKNIEKYSNDCRKIYADLYVDDRCVGGWKGWEVTLSYIRLIEEENRKIGK